MTVSITELDTKMRELKKVGIKTRAQKDQYKEAKTALNKAYNEAKVRVMEFESTNFEYLMLMRSTNDFYKMFGNSALFYAYRIAPELNLTANLQFDADFTVKSEVGFVPIKNVAKLATQLKKLKIVKVKTDDKTGNFLLFKVPWRFTEEEIKRLAEDNDHKVRNFNRLVMTNNTVPVLFLTLEDLQKALYENVRRMGPVERDLFGIALGRQAMELICKYFRLANGKLEEEECFVAIRGGIDEIKYQVKAIADLKIWTPKVCGRIGDIIVRAQEILASELRRVQREKRRKAKAAKAAEDAKTAEVAKTVESAKTAKTAESA